MYVLPTFLFSHCVNQTGLKRQSRPAKISDPSICGTFYLDINPEPNVHSLRELLSPSIAK
jgi:hypothetical protein